MVAAVANANTAFFMSEAFPVLGTPTRRAGNGFPRSGCMTRAPPHVPTPSSGYHVLPVRTIALIGAETSTEAYLRLRCRRWVTSVVLCNRRLPVNFRFAPFATGLMSRCNMSRRARCRLMRRSTLLHIALIPASLPGDRLPVVSQDLCRSETHFAIASVSQKRDQMEKV
jgi:hypothetical protein